MAAPREMAGPDLALIVAGKPKGGGRKPPPGGAMSDADDTGAMGADDEQSELPPGFESAAAEAFPDMSADQYPALKRLIALCMESPEY
jgi:hypothetical protein